MFRRILVTGASGQLGGYLLRELRHTDATVIAWSGTRVGTLFGFPWLPVDFAKPDQLASAFRKARPDLVVHAAAMSRIDECHRDPRRARAVNREGTTTLVELSAEVNARLVYVSTDLVFDGQQGWYAEEDAPAPLSVYGKTKVAAEQPVLANDRGSAVRVSLLFGPTRVSRPAFFDRQVEAVLTACSLPLFEDEWRTPLSLQTAAQSLLAVAESDHSGLLHLGGPERMSRLEMGRRLAASLGGDDTMFRAAKQADVPGPEPRPPDVSLDSEQFRKLFPHLPWPEWEEALSELGMREWGDSNERATE